MWLHTHTHSHTEREKEKRSWKAVGRNGNRKMNRKGKGRKRKGGRQFKWPSQDNSKNAFKRKSVKKFRLWPTDCANGNRGSVSNQGWNWGRAIWVSARVKLKNKAEHREGKWKWESSRWKTSRLAFGKLNCFRFCSHFPALFAFNAPNK